MWTTWVKAFSPPFFRNPTRAATFPHFATHFVEESQKRSQFTPVKPNADNSPVQKGRLGVESGEAERRISVMPRVGFVLSGEGLSWEVV